MTNLCQIDSAFLFADLNSFSGSLEAQNLLRLLPNQCTDTAASRTLLRVQRHRRRMHKKPKTARSLLIADQRVQRLGTLR